MKRRRDQTQEKLILVRKPPRSQIKIEDLIIKEKSAEVEIILIIFWK